MKADRWFAATFLSLLLLMGGKTDPLGSPGLVVAYQGQTRDTSLTPDGNDYMPVCNSSVSLMFDDTDARSYCYVMEGYRLQLTEWTFTATTDLLDANDEQCALVIETSSDGTAATGTEVDSSEISVGETNPNAAGTCLPSSSVTLDGRGDACNRKLDLSDTNTVVGSGGWFRVKPNSPGGSCVGECTCAAIRSGEAFILGTLIREDS